MSVPKRHHTAPRVYLENFVESDGRLTVSSKRNGNEFRVKPDKALTRYHYYSQPVDGVENADQTLESDLFNKIETQYPTLFDALLNNTEAVDIEVLVKTILSMHVRSPGFRESFEIGLAKFVDRRVKAMPKSSFPPPPKGYENIWDNLVVTIDPHRSLHAMAYYLANYASILTTLRYQILLAPKGSSFLTSDNPVAWYEARYGNFSPKVFQFEVTKKTRAIFPISPSAILLGKQSNTNDIRLESRRKVASRQQVREANEIQLACAWDHIVGFISLPKTSKSRFSHLAPRFAVEEYDPDTGRFRLSSIKLGAFDKKHKYTQN